MKTNIHYILLTALRDWLFAGLFIGVIASSYISAIMGDMALVEPDQLKVVYAAASCRMVLIVGLIVFVCFHIRAMFDTKEIDVFLSRPISRASLVVSYWFGFSVVALMLVLPSIIIIELVGKHDLNGFYAWAGSLTLEALLVVAVALFSAFTLKSAVSSVMASLGFYVLSRMMGFFIATSQSPMLFRSQPVSEWSKTLMEWLAIFVPRLDFFAKTQWLVYGLQHGDEMWRVALQAAIFVPLLLVATIADFRRKQF